MTDWYRYYVLVLNPILQIAVLFAVLYWLLRGLMRISAVVKLKGLAFAVLLAVVAGLLAQRLQFHALNWLLQNAASFTALMLAVVFQPEMRRLFTRLGGLLPAHAEGDQARILDQLVEAVQVLSSRRIGALMVVERNDKLDDFIGSSPFDCDLTVKSLVTIFWKDAPLHDGAVIIRGGRVAAAGVILPLTENFAYKDLSGTRHRAGIGISEETDALAVVVSEETGIVSVAERGKLQRDLSQDDLRILLRRVFAGRPARQSQRRGSAA